VGKVEEKKISFLDPLFRGTDPGNRIHTKMSRIPKTGIRDGKIGSGINIPYPQAATLQNADPEHRYI
jgi:hypothetical protein